MRILITGASGLVGSALKRTRDEKVYPDVWFVERKHANLENLEEVNSLFLEIRPDVVIHSAAMVGGIEFNRLRPSEMFIRNSRLNINVLEAASLSGVSTIIGFASNCMYPTNSPLPLEESCFASGPLEETNLGFGLAKRHLTQAFQLLDGSSSLNAKVLVPSNLYGPNDSFAPERAHLIGAIIGKVKSAIDEQSKVIKVWGSGLPRREFLYVDDLASWIWKSIPTSPNFPTILNLGSGEELSVTDYYKRVLTAFNYSADLHFDQTKPDGVFSKLLDSSRAREEFAWSPKTSISQGLAKIIDSWSSH